MKALLLLAALLAVPTRAHAGGEEEPPARPAGPAREEPRREPAKDPAPPARKEAPAKEAPKPAKDAAAKEAPKTAAPARRAPRSKEEALRVLDGLVLPAVTFDATPLPRVVAWLSDATGVNMVLGPALVKEGDPESVRVTMTLRAVTARQVLDLVTEGHGLGVGFQIGRAHV